MAIQPPPVPVVAQQSVGPAVPRKGGCMGRGCGCSCLGCLGVGALVALQPSAAVTAPATLIVFSQPVTVNSRPSRPGQALNAGDEVQTQAGGHAAIQFPDGSYGRMSPGTTVQVNSVQLQRNGQLQA